VRAISTRHNRILDLWASGHTSTEIIALGWADSVPTVRSVVRDWKRLGDPRATARLKITPPDPLTREFVLSLFSYDSEAGELRRLSPLSGAQRGALAGCLKRGYRSVKIACRAYYVHHLIWLIETGSLPVSELDHRDTNKGNNRFSNLRSCTDSQNSTNRGPNRNNTTGFKGVVLVKANMMPSRKPFVARIKHQGRSYYLGCFATAAEGSAAYNAAARRLAGEFAWSASAHPEETV
jgi:hypothetical protein